MLEAYCALAVERGIAEIAITDHVDFDPIDARLRVRLVRRPGARRARGGGALGRPRARGPVRRRGHLRARVRGPDPRLAPAPPPRLRHRQRPHQRRARRTRRRNVATFVAGRRSPEIVAPYFDEVIGAARSGLFDTHRPPRLREALPRAARHARRPRRGARAVRAGARRADRDAGRRSRSTRPACASCRARRIRRRAIVAPLPRPRRPQRDHRHRRPPNRVVRISGSGRRIVTRRAPDSRRWRSGVGAIGCRSRCHPAGRTSSAEA